MKKKPLPRALIDEDGLVDLQVNGFKGVDFSDPALSVEDVRAVTTGLRQSGTAGYLATVTTSAPETYERTLPVLARAMSEPDLRDRILGIHIEGPFISPPARGAHPLEHLRKPDISLFDRWQKLAGGRIVMLTLAPELPGAIDLISHASCRGVTVSLGHHMASHRDMAVAVEAGAACCTHIGNGIPNTLPRHPNPIWSQLAEDRLTGMFITDGHHLPAEFVKVAIRAKSIERFIVTSDCTSIAGMPPGEYSSLGAVVVLEPSGRLYVKGSDSLAGSSSSQAECMAWLRSLGLLTEAELRQVCRVNPLRLLGYDI